MARPATVCDSQGGIEFVDNRTKFPPTISQSQCIEVVGNSGPATIKVLTWNILAKGLSNEAADWGGFDKVPKEVLDWTTRRQLICEEIDRQDPDIFCLQECDDPSYFNVQYSHKYRTFTVARDGSKCCDFTPGADPDGLFIACRRTLRVISSTFRVFNTSKRHSFAMIEMECKGHTFCIATTHLKSEKSQHGAAIRMKQAHELFLCLPLTPIPCIVLGDMNATPEEVAKWELDIPGYVSAYDPEKTEFTSRKIRGDNESKYVIDYIFYHPDDMKCIDTQELPTDIPYPYLPSAEHPSDHLPLCATFAF